MLVAGVEEGGDEVLGFSFEKSAEEVFEGGALGLSFVDDRAVEVASAFLGMFDHVLVFKSGEKGAHGGVGWRISEFVLNILRGGFAKAVKDVEDLSFAARDFSFFETVHESDLAGARKPANKMLEIQHHEVLGI